MKKIYLSVLTMFLLLENTPAQVKPFENKNGFTVIKQLPVTAIKQQYKTNTCWSFATISFLESELIRIGKGDLNLSEMFIVRNVYIEKADKYLRMHGHINFSGGGTLTDPIDIIKRYGIVPDSIYTGLVNGNTNHVHFEMDDLLKSYMESMVKNNNADINQSWMNGFIGILDAYMGKPISDFTMNEKRYFPQSYAQSLGLNLNDYILLTSFDYKPYYQKNTVEVPDNWMSATAYNIKLDEITALFDSSINRGYSLCWAGDITEKSYKWSEGTAYTDPSDEAKISTQMRQDAFNNYSTQDDHAMHVMGIAKDKAGNKMYLMKNSWGATDNALDGYMMLSVDYVKYKTITIMANKNALPETLRKNLGL